MKLSYFLEIFTPTCPKNALFAVIVKIVCKTLFSEEIRVFYGKTMF